VQAGAEIPRCQKWPDLRIIGAAERLGLNTLKSSHDVEYSHETLIDTPLMVETVSIRVTE
jgi:hypothetical protein